MPQLHKFVVQHKDGPRAKWKPGRFHKEHDHLADAVKEARSLDQDGFIHPGTCRIVQGNDVVDPASYAHLAMEDYI